MHPSLKVFESSLQSGTRQKVIMFGDSITFGSQVDPDFDFDIVYHRQWHDALRTHYPKANLEIINRGVPGHKIGNALDRVDAEVLEADPELVVIEFGINDCWDGPDKIDGFENGLTVLAKNIRENTKAAVVLMTANMMNHSVTPDALKKAWFAETSAKAQTSGWMADYMACVRRVAKNLDLPLADGYARWEKARQAGVDTDALLANGANHPNAEGHKLLAEALLEVLDLNLKDNS